MSSGCCHHRTHCYIRAFLCLSVCLFLIRHSSEFRGLIKLAPSFKRKAARDPGELICGALEMTASGPCSYIIPCLNSKDSVLIN